MPDLVGYFGPPTPKGLDALRRMHDSAVDQAVSHERMARHYRREADGILAEIRQLRASTVSVKRD